MGLFGRKKWPAKLERRLPENANMRKQHDKDAREKVKQAANLAAEQTGVAQLRIDKIAEVLFNKGI